MTTTDTQNVDASSDQVLSLIKAGSELVRLTAPSIKDADALEHISGKIKEAGEDVPLVADIHFTPNAAFRAADFVEKIRINPGNFADRKKFDHHEYTDESYAAELERIRDKFTPLVLKCKELGRAIRIGTNHGSLSDRITSRYGDTPLGMVESALEFIRICKENDFHDIVISMKSSNTFVMTSAYRMLVSRMEAEGMDYPLHLGVTEAGDGEDGRIKSAVGIGTLLEEGMGDTIRVSLTEAPEAEIPVANKIVARYVDHEALPVPSMDEKLKSGVVPLVILTVNQNPKQELSRANLLGAGYRYSVTDDKWNIADAAADMIYTANRKAGFPLPGTLKVLLDAEHWEKGMEGHAPLWPLEKLDVANSLLEEGILDQIILQVCTGRSDFSHVPDGSIVIVSSEVEKPLGEYREAYQKLAGRCSVIFRNRVDTDDDELFTLYQSIDLGGVMIDGWGDGIWVEGDQSLAKRCSLSFGILQATRRRISKTEYISCPSCGRTLFDLEETTAKIRKVTSHLKGVKIGIMGCIVNGPGEMADADFGYVGTGPGKITLYREKEVVRKNVPEDEAVEALIDLIKSEGFWVEP
jgi:(E)-4-hydroxy-3-methylbut-2-enyl-diphosphate synthase